MSKQRNIGQFAEIQDIIDAEETKQKLIDALKAAQAALLALSTPDAPGDMPDALLEQIASALEQAEAASA